MFRRTFVLVAAFFFALPFFVSAQEASSGVSDFLRNVSPQEGIDGLTSEQRAEADAFMSDQSSDESSFTSVVVANINLSDAVVLSQDGASIITSVTIANQGNTPQGDIRYGVELLKNTDQGQETVDTFVVDETLSLAAGQSVRKEITYDVPSFLSGDYEVWVVSKTTGGLPLGFAKAGDVTFSGSRENIGVGHCFLSVAGDDTKYALDRSVGVGKDETLSISCEMRNLSSKSISVYPRFVTHKRSLYGERVGVNYPSTSEVTFSANEKKVVGFVIAKPNEPQSYVTSVVFVEKETEATLSSETLAYYAIEGANATIENISLDRASYKEGESMVVTLLAERSDPAADVSVKIDITDGSGAVCVSPVTRKISVTEVLSMITLVATKDCFAPNLSAVLLDGGGGVFDSRVVASPKEMKPASPVSTGESVLTAKSVAVGFVAVLFLVALGFIGRRIFSGTDGVSSGIKSILFFGLLLSGISVSGGGAEAVSWIGYFNAYSGPQNPGSIYLTATVQADKSTYVPGEKIRLTGSLVTHYGNSGSTASIRQMLSASSNGPVATLIDRFMTDRQTVSGTAELTAVAGSTVINLGQRFFYNASWWNDTYATIPISVSGSTSCTAPWGATVANGTSVSAYSTASVSPGGDCASARQTRTCTNGTLSGTYTYQSCSVSAATLSVVLSASPNSGNAPLNNVNLSATVSGTATGNMNYKFDCTNDGSWDVQQNNSLANPYTKLNACSYPVAGTYTAKVEVSRQGIVASATTQIVARASCVTPWGATVASGSSVDAYSTASVPSGGSCLNVQQTRVCSNGTLSGTYTNQSCVVAPSLSVSLSANPSSGDVPLNNVNLSARVSGTATGNMDYKFDCTNDGSWDRIVSGSNANPYTLTNVCRYPVAGTYTAKVEVSRQGIVASATAQIVVNAPAIACTTPWGTTVASGSSVMGYLDEFVPYLGSSCFGISRVCTDGILSAPSFSHESCSVIPWATITAPESIPPLGVDIHLGDRVTFSGTGTDSDGTIDQNEWRDRDCNTGDVLDSGYGGASTFSTATLSVGTHYVYFRVKDNSGAWSTNCPYRIVVVRTNPPTVPIVTGPTTGVVGVANTFTFLSTDPDGDSIHYGADWGLDGGTDEWTPGGAGPYQYVRSGTAQSMNRTWNTPGTYTFEVLAQDEHSAVSPWVRHTIVISPAAPVTTFSANPTDLPFGGGSVDLFWSVTNAVPGTCTGYSTTGVSDWSLTGSGGKPVSGSSRVNVTETTRFDLDCWNTSNGVWTPAARKQVQVNVAAPTLSVVLSASPSFGTAPVNNVSLTATVGGTATGGINYKFDCTNDGSWEKTLDGSSANPYTQTNACSYSTAGTYTARVMVERNSAPAAYATIPIVVSAPVSTLKICPGSCTGGGAPYNTLTNFAALPVTLYACLGTGTACDSTNNPVSGTWTEKNTPNNAISLSQTTGTTTIVTRTYSGSGSADEDIILSYNAASVTARAHVACIDSTDYCAQGAASICTGQTYTGSYTTTCGGTGTCNTAGTRSCNSGGSWKEVAP